MPKVKEEIPVLVTTESRGVFFGYTHNPSGPSIELTRARNCLYWSVDVKGFLGLAVTGPSATCRIGPAAANLVLHGVTCVARVSQIAVRAWEAAPWPA